MNTSGKLEALGGVQRHQRHARLGGVGVGVGDQRGVVEKLGQGLAALLRVLRGVGEFLQVLDAREGFGRGLFFERADVAGAVVEELDQFRQSGGLAGLAEPFDAGLARISHQDFGGALRRGVRGALEHDRREGVELGRDGARGVCVAAFSWCNGGDLFVGPKSKPKLKLVSKEVSGSVRGFLCCGFGYKFSGLNSVVLAAASTIPQTRRLRGPGRR
jgi:hypothetical protein